MTNRDRFRAVLNFEKPDDRLPMIEWAGWWDKTVRAWREQGLPETLGWGEIAPYLGLDQHVQYWLPHTGPGCPSPAFNGGPIMEDEEGYEAILPYLYPDRSADGAMADMARRKKEHDAGEYPIWITLEGGFWFPRRLFGIEGHLYSFYDYPELYHRILGDLADYELRREHRELLQILHRSLGKGIVGTYGIHLVIEELHTHRMVAAGREYVYYVSSYRKLTEALGSVGSLVAHAHKPCGKVLPKEPPPGLYRYYVPQENVPGSELS